MLLFFFINQPVKPWKPQGQKLFIIQEDPCHPLECRGRMGLSLQIKRPAVRDASGNHVDLILRIHFCQESSGRCMVAPEIPKFLQPPPILFVHIRILDFFFKPLEIHHESPFTVDILGIHPQWENIGSPAKKIVWHDAKQHLRILCVKAFCFPDRWRIIFTCLIHPCKRLHMIQQLWKIQPRFVVVNRIVPVVASGCPGGIMLLPVHIFTSWAFCRFLLAPRLVSYSVVRLASCFAISLSVFLAA